MIESNIDLNVWQYDDQKENISIPTLVRNALRSNPDWLIVAESRGEEMRDVLNSALTGHPIITTLHAKSIETMPSRIVSMVMMGDKKTSYRDVRFDVYSHFKVYVFLKKHIDNGIVTRYINQIGFISNTGEQEIVYVNDGTKAEYRPFSEQLLNSIPFKQKTIESWCA